MIANITRGSSPKGLANYLHGEGRDNEHIYENRLGGAVIGGNLGAYGQRDGSSWATEMAEVIAQRREVSKPVWHMSVRAAADDPVMSDERWRSIAQEMGERMGWSEQPWAMVRHGSDHVHIVVSRVGWDGQLWHGRDDYRAAQKARQAIEKRYGLKQAPVQRRTTSVPLSRGEVSKGLATGNVPERQQLADLVRAARSAGEGLGREHFEALLAEQQVLFRANVASTGRMSGYSFGLPGHVNAQGEQVWFKASQLDKELSWKNLNGVLESRLPEPRYDVPEKKFLESKTKHAERVQVVRREAMERDRSMRRWNSRGVMKETTKRNSTRRFLWWRNRHLTSRRKDWHDRLQERAQYLLMRAASFPNSPQRALDVRNRAVASKDRKSVV